MKENEKKIGINDFLAMSRGDVAKIVKEKGTPRCVCIMLDGTRRVLKLEPGFHDDKWLYYEDHITGLIHKSFEVVDTFFDYGLETVVGPLASLGNLNRKEFMPVGLERLLAPLMGDYPRSILEKHNSSISFYGDLETAKAMKGGEIIDKYTNLFREINPHKPSKHILIGVGFSTDSETDVIANQAIDHFEKFSKRPSHKDLVVQYFGYAIPPIDIFLRTNEVKASGGLTPLLIQHDTQLYFPVAPGIMSLSENVLRRILYDYLFNRVLSHGMHQHEPITESEAFEVKSFYTSHKDQVLGIGRRIGDIWIHEENS